MSRDSLDVSHVLRPGLPWRPAEELTECGRDPARLDVITRDALQARARSWGRQRTYMTTCVTCLDTSQRWPRWEDSPGGCLARYIMRGRQEDHERLDRELRAIALLIEAHRGEFDATVEALAAAVPIRPRRQA